MRARNKREENDTEFDPDLIERTRSSGASTGTYYFEKTKPYILNKNLKLKVDPSYKATLYFDNIAPIAITKCSGKNLIKTAKLGSELIDKPFYVIFEYLNYNKSPSEWGFCTEPFKFTDRTFRVGANGYISIAVTDCDKFIRTMFNNETGIYYTETVYATIIKEFEKMARPLLVDIFDDVHPFVKSADYLLENYNIELEDFFFKKNPCYFEQFGVKIFLPEFSSPPPQNASGHFACNVYVNKDCLESEAIRFRTLFENAQKQAENEEKRIYDETEIHLAEAARKLDEEDKQPTDEERSPETESQRRSDDKSSLELEAQRLIEEAGIREKALRKREESLKKREDKLKKSLKDSLGKIENAKKLEKEILQRIEEAKKLEADAVKKAEAANALERELTQRIEALNAQLKASTKTDDVQDTSTVTEPMGGDSANKGKKTVKKTVVKRIPKPSSDTGEPETTAEAPSEGTAKKTVVVKKTIVKKKSPDASGAANTATDGNGTPNA
ncbi:MAG: hypothetical protein IJY04_09295 [Clostridia bacterium]|nr:hypothetical protein [Clostridia bacterium]